MEAHSLAGGSLSPERAGPDPRRVRACARSFGATVRGALHGAAVIDPHGGLGTQKNTIALYNPGSISINSRASRVLLEEWPSGRRQRS